MLAQISQIAAGLLAGSFLMGTLGIRPAIDALGEREEISLRKDLIPVLRRYLPTLMVACILSSLGAMISSKSHVETARDACASAIWIAILVLTISVHRPVNEKILQLEVGQLPDDIGLDLLRWNRADTIRMCLAIAGFILLEVG